MSITDNELTTLDATKANWLEYELAVKTQMHFNEILMKYRSVGISVVVAVYSYAISRPTSEFATVFSATPSRVIGLVGVGLTFLLALIDLLYFLPLLLGAVDRSRVLEKSTSFGLASAISRKVSASRTFWLIGILYGSFVIVGLVLVFLVLPIRVQAI